MVVPELLTTQVRQCRVRLTLGTHYISRTGGNTYCFDGAGSLLLSSTTPERYDLELSDPAPSVFAVLGLGLRGIGLAETAHAC
jgi:hypothetical protein